MSILFEGSYVNPAEALWLRAIGPQPAPANLQVSTLTVNPSGGIAMRSGGEVYPSTTGAAVAFNRADNGASNATELQQTPSKTVPTKGAETTYLASVTASGFSYDDIALQGLQIYGPQLTAPSANTGCAGYLTQGSTPFSVKLYTGNFETPVVNTDTIHARVGVFSTINISSGTFSIPDPLTLSTINVSTLNANLANISTLNVSSFALTNVVASSIVASSITTSSLTSAIGTFSTLIAPGFSGGGGINASTINSSTITTGLLSTVTAVTKEIFASTLVLNATVSPKVDLGLGGLIGGLIGSATSNTLGVALGAANLATGIGILAQGRQTGGINPSVFQTINGTAQLQFSTLGAVTPTTFTLTDSLDPQHTPGFPVNTTTYIPANSYCVRTVSDPLSLLNNSGVIGQGIQGFSQWEPVYPGNVQIGNNVISSILNGNTINFGDFGQGMTIIGGGGRTTTFGTPVVMSSLVVQGAINATSVVSPLIQAVNASASTLVVSTFVIGTQAFNNLNLSTLNVQTSANFNGTLGFFTMTGNSINTRTIDAITSVGTTTLNATTGNINTLNAQSASISTLAVYGEVVTSTITSPAASISNLSTTTITGVNTINGAAYPPPSSVGIPAGMIMAYAGQGCPTGWIPCRGGVYDGTNPTYAALFAAIGLSWGGTGTQFFIPDLRSRTIFGAVKDGTSGPYPTGAFVALYAGTFSRIPGATTPFGLPANQVLSVNQIDGEIRVGMGLYLNSDFPLPVITNIFNYNGGPFTGAINSPNNVVICMDRPFVNGDVSPGIGMVAYSNNAPGACFVGNTYTANYGTQTAIQVAQHTHPNGFANGGINAPNQANNPIQGRDTGTNNPERSYTLNGTTFNIPVVTNNMPSMGVCNWVIKY